MQEFLDMIAPSVAKFESDYFICGNTFRCVWAQREYPIATDEQVILSCLGEILERSSFCHVSSCPRGIPSSG